MSGKQNTESKDALDWHEKTVRQSTTGVPAEAIASLPVKFQWMLADRSGFTSYNLVLFPWQYALTGFSSHTTPLYSLIGCALLLRAKFHSLLALLPNFYGPSGHPHLSGYGT